MLQLVQSFWPTATKAELLVVMFVIYAISIVVFGFLYWVLFRRNKHLFLFQSEIGAAQQRAVVARSQHSIEMMSTEVAAMEEVHSALLQGVLEMPRPVLPSGHRVETSTYVITGRTPQEFQERLRLRVADERGKVLCDVEGPQDAELTREYFTQWLGGMLDTWRERIEESRRRLADVEKDWRSSFGFFDFLYFSCITQTTVGYGDILPNSTSIRMVVSCQILVGYMVIVVLIAMIGLGS